MRALRHLLLALLLCASTALAQVSTKANANLEKLKFDTLGNLIATVTSSGGGGFVTGTGTTNSAAMWTTTTSIGNAPSTNFLTEAQITNLTTDLANLAQSSGGSTGGTGAVGSSLNSGCGYFNTTGLTFAVSACTYYINGTAYTSAAATVTLTAADVTNPRIDSLIVDTTPIATKVDGTAAANPSEPALDPTTQLKLASVLVNANGTTPANLSNENAYKENTEWTCTAGTGWDCANTGNPHGGTKSIKATAVTANNFTKLVRSSTININQFQLLGLWVAPVTWTNARSLVLTLRDANGVQVGNAITIQNGSYGFVRTNTAYQLISIPVAQFAVPAATLVKELRFNPLGSGGTFTFYIDDVIFQTSTNNTPFPNPQYDARYLPQGSSNTLQKKDATTGQLAPSSVTDDGTTVSTSEAASVGALTYNGKLTQSDITTVTSSGNLSHGVTICGSGASGNVTLTSPTSPALGETYKIIQENASHTCIFTPGGSTTIDSGAGTVTLSAGAALSKDEVCVATTSGSSAVWHCTGAGT